MSFPSTSNFNSATARSAWWKNLRSQQVCEGVGTGLIVALQIVLRGALKPGWRGPDGASHSVRPAVDGTWGPITAAALWSYAGTRGPEAIAVRPTVEIDILGKKISVASTRLALWLAFYAPRHVDLAEGTGTVVREDAPILSPITLDEIQLPDDVILWKWLQRPAVPGDLTALGAQVPVCRTISFSDLGQRDDLPGDLPGKVPVPPATPPPPTWVPPVAPPPAQASGSGGGGFFVAIIAAVVAVAVLRKKRRR